jgi:hypothetical protein
MIIIVASLGLVAIFANIQRLRRGQIETIIVVPASFGNAPAALTFI